jgi:hypothetical protein
MPIFLPQKSSLWFLVFFFSPLFPLSPTNEISPYFLFYFIYLFIYFIIIIIIILKTLIPKLQYFTIKKGPRVT